MSDREDNNWPVIESEVEYKNGWYTGGYDRVKQPNGTEKKYYWAALTDATVVVARLANKLIFVQQYRPAIRQHCLELPAGLVEDGETFETAGQRELLEETGYRAGHVELIEEVSCTTGLLRHQRGFIFADDLTKTGRQPDGNEFITIKTIEIKNALDVTRQSPSNDATLEGILLAKADGLLSVT